MRKVLSGFGLALATSALTTTAILAACSSDSPATGSPPPPSGEVRTVKSELPRDTEPDVSAQDAQAVADGNRAFALDLFHAVGGGSGNFMFSPWSISIALAMTYAGAQGTTADQLPCP